MSAFHSDYREATLSVGFIVGFFDLILVRLFRFFRLTQNLVVLSVVAFFLDWFLIKGTGSGNFEGNYYVTGNVAPVVVALLLAITLIVVESVKRRLLINK